MARLRDKDKNDIAPALAKEFEIKNPMAIPKIEKVVINMGLGEASANAKILDVAADELKAITGQKPVITKAKKSIAAFKLRQGMAIDGRGNYTLGIREQLIFPEIDFNKVDKTRGMNISIITTANTDEQARS